MNQKDAQILLERLQAEGFSSGIDCAAYCLDGHYGIRSAKGGQPRSERWCVSVTPMERVAQLKTAVESGTLTAHDLVGHTIYITGWTP